MPLQWQCMAVRAFYSDNVVVMHRSKYFCSDHAMEVHCSEDICSGRICVVGLLQRERGGCACHLAEDLCNVRDCSEDAHWPFEAARTCAAEAVHFAVI